MIGRFGAWPAWAFMGLFFVLPLAALALKALAEGGGAWARLYANPLLPGALRNTLALGLTAGACRRWWGRRWPWNWRASERRRRWMITLLGMPLAFSGLVIAYGFILGYGRAGFVTQLLAGAGADPARVGAWIYSATGLGFAYVYYLVPRVALSLYPVSPTWICGPCWRRVPWARRAGAPSATRCWRRWPRRCWPMPAWSRRLPWGPMARRWLAGTQLNILPLMLYAQIGDGGSDFGVAAALSLLLMALCVAVMGVGDALARRRR